MLKITIITAVYNGERYLKKTIDSVVKQSYENIEYIIVDGKSTDSTPEIINENRHRLSCVISESDNSMYEAINRGIRAATGDYILVLNSDDCLVDKETISQVVDFINEHPNKLAYYGNIINQKGEYLEKRRVFQISHSHLLYTRHGTLVPHPTLFVHRTTSLSTVGFYDLSYRYASDFDYILRLLEVGQVIHMKIFVTIFRIHENSITSSGKIDQERLNILGKYGNSRPILIKLIYYFLIWMRYKVLNIVENRIQ